LNAPLTPSGSAKLATSAANSCSPPERARDKGNEHHGRCSSLHKCPDARDDDPATIRGDTKTYIRDFDRSLSELADLADELAETLAQRERDRPIQPRRQLVHGDFWDNNVRFRHGQVALVTDFDFLADHPRTDDLALTLYLTSVDITDITSDPTPLTELADAYESASAVRLTSVGQRHEEHELHLRGEGARRPAWQR